MDESFKILKTTANSKDARYTNYFINNSGVVLTRKGKQVQPTITESGLEEVILMIDGFAHKKLVKDLVIENF